MDEHTCPWWFVHSFDNPLRRWVQNPRAILANLVERGQTVMDVGCGAGYFSFALAEIVGAGGKVVALDIQEKMLEIARRRAERRRLNRRIEFRLCDSDSLGPSEPVDFILAFWMVHEVSDREAFLEELRGLLKPDGALLIVEPKVHVPAHRFKATADLARRAGLEVAPGPRVFFSRSIVCSL